MQNTAGCISDEAGALQKSELPRVRMEGTALTQKPIYLDRVFCSFGVFSLTLGVERGTAYTVGMVELRHHPSNPDEKKEELP